MVVLAIGVLLGMGIMAAALYCVSAANRRAHALAGVVYRIGEIVEEDAPDISA